MTDHKQGVSSRAARHVCPTRLLLPLREARLCTICRKEHAYGQSDGQMSTRSCPAEQLSVPRRAATHHFFEKSSSKTGSSPRVIHVHTHLYPVNDGAFIDIYGSFVTVPRKSSVRIFQESRGLISSGVSIALHLPLHHAIVRRRAGVGDSRYKLRCGLAPRWFPCSGCSTAPGMFTETSNRRTSAW